MKHHLLSKILIGLCLLSLLHTFEAAYAQDSVKVKNLNSDRNDFAITVCLSLPSTDAWWPQAGLEINGEEMKEVGVLLIDGKKPETMQSKNRCYLIEIPIQSDALKIEDALFTLKSIRLNREPDYLDKTFLDSLRKTVQKTEPELDFEVDVTQTETGGGAAIIITSKPAGMTEEEAMRMIDEAANPEISIDWKLPVYIE